MTFTILGVLLSPSPEHEICGAAQKMQMAYYYLRFPHVFHCVSALLIFYSQKLGNDVFPLAIEMLKTSFCVKAEDTWLHQRREKMLFAFKLLRNISLASLSAECQDSVCKQSVHVRVVTWRKLLSCCPRSLTPEVNPDIDTYRASDVPRRCATPESYHSVITPHGVKRPTRLVGGK